MKHWFIYYGNVWANVSEEHYLAATSQSKAWFIDDSKFLFTFFLVDGKEVMNRLFRTISEECRYPVREFGYWFELPVLCEGKQSTGSVCGKISQRCMVVAYNCCPAF